MTPSEMARALGRKGGRARARNLTNPQKRQIASLGGVARRQSLQAATRMTENLRYAAVVAELQPLPPVVGLKTFKGRLPGVYRDHR